MATISELLKTQEALDRALGGSVVRDLVQNSTWARTARLMSEESSRVRLARQVSEQSLIGRTARLMSEQSSVRRMAEHLRGVTGSPMSRFVEQMRQLPHFETLAAQNHELVSSRAMASMVRDMKINFAHLRSLTEDSALFRNAHLLEGSLTRGTTAYTFGAGQGALEAVNAGAFVNLHSLHAFSDLAGSSERLIRNFAPIAASGLAALPPMLRRAPLIEPYLSARALSWFEPEIVADADLTVDDGPLVDELARSCELRLRQRGWDDLGETVSAGLDRVLDDPGAPARIPQFCFVARTTIKVVVERLAPRKVVKAWVAEQRQRGTYSEPPLRIMEFRSAKNWVDPVRYVMRGANDLCDGYAQFGRFDLVDFLYVLDRLDAATHLKGIEDISAEGLAPVFQRFLGFMSLLLEAAEFNEPLS